MLRLRKPEKSQEQHPLDIKALKEEEIGAACLQIKEEAIVAASFYGKTILYAHFAKIFHTPETHGNEEYCKLLKLIVDYIKWEDYQERICLTKSPEPALPPS
jgi:hypothetical protein